MAAQNISLKVHEIALGAGFAGVILDEGGVILVRHKTDLLAVGLVGHIEADLLRHPPNLVLVVAAHGHQGSGKLLLGQVV